MLKIIIIFIWIVVSMLNGLYASTVFGTTVSILLAAYIAVFSFTLSILLESLVSYLSNWGRLAKDRNEASLGRIKISDPAGDRIMEIVREQVFKEISLEVASNPVVARLEGENMALERQLRQLKEDLGEK